MTSTSVFTCGIPKTSSC